MRRPVLYASVLAFARTGARPVLQIARAGGAEQIRPLGGGQPRPVLWFGDFFCEKIAWAPASALGRALAGRAWSLATLAARPGRALAVTTPKGLICSAPPAQQAITQPRSAACGLVGRATRARLGFILKYGKILVQKKGVRVRVCRIINKCTYVRKARLRRASAQHICIRAGGNALTRVVVKRARTSTCEVRLCQPWSVPGEDFREISGIFLKFL